MKRDVRLRVRASLPERLLSLAAEKGIALTEVRRPAEGLLVMDLGPREARRFLALCERCGLSADVERVGGTGKLTAWLRRRATLAAGILAFALLTPFALSRLWRVDIAFTGTSASLGNRAEVAAALEALGVRPGGSAGIDAARLSSELAARLPGYSYVGAKVRGVRLLVEAVPEARRPELYALDAPRDLVADRDGIVVSVNALAGEPCVKPGDAVRRGQLLIRGEERARADATRPIAALGQVVVRAWIEGTAALPLRQTAALPTGRASASGRLALFGWSVPLSEGESYARQRVRVRRLPIVGLFLPVEIVREERQEVREEAVKADEGRLKARLAALALADARTGLPGGSEGWTPERQWLEYDIDGEGRMTARAVLEITTDTAVERNALYQGG